MKISNISFSNFKGNIYRYIMYLLSNVFAVSSFFIFLNFLFHPAIDINNLGGHYAAAIGASMAVKFCLVVIVGFSILFVYYGNGQFIKSRAKEIGLLSLYGMTKKQIRKYMFIENTILSVLSLVLGTGVGILFSKLFLMIMERFIEVSLPLVISKLVILITMGLFLIIFEFINLISVIRINDKEIVEQIKYSKKPKNLPVFSKKKAILGLVLVVAGYIISWNVEGVMVILAMIPVASIIFLGTYFLITEFTMYFLNELNENKKIKYNKTNIITLSQLIFKLQDTTKILFLSAILGTITFTATETIFTFFKDVDVITGGNMGQDIVFVDLEDNSKSRDVFEKYKDLAKKEGFKIKNETAIRFIQVDNINEGLSIAKKTAIVQESDYNNLAEKLKETSYRVQTNEAIYVEPLVGVGFNGKIDEMKNFDNENARLQVNDEEYELDIISEENGSVISLNRMGIADFYIVSDECFDSISDLAGEDKVNILYGLNVQSMKEAYGATKVFMDEYGYKESPGIMTDILSHVEVRKNFGMILFIGFFLSFLFFIASGSLVYFKLFNELKQDRVEYGILRNVGIKNKELNKIITRQIGLILFIPFIVSTVHSFFALKALSNFVGLNLVLNGLIVLFGYLIFQLLYFIIIRIGYIKKLSIL